MIVYENDLSEHQRADLREYALYAKIHEVPTAPNPIKSLIHRTFSRWLCGMGFFQSVSSTQGFITQYQRGGIRAIRLPSANEKGNRGILSVSSRVVKTLQAFIWWSECLWNLKTSQLQRMLSSAFQDEISFICFLSTSSRQMSPQCSMYSMISRKKKPESPKSRKYVTFQEASTKSLYSLQAKKKRMERQVQLTSTQIARYNLLYWYTNLCADQYALRLQAQRLWFLGLVMGSFAVPTYLWCRQRCSIGQTVNWKTARFRKPMSLNPRSGRWMSSWEASIEAGTRNTRPTKSGTCCMKVQSLIGQSMNSFAMVIQVNNMLATRGKTWQTLLLSSLEWLMGQESPGSIFPSRGKVKMTAMMQAGSLVRRYVAQTNKYSKQEQQQGKAYLSRTLIGSFCASSGDGPFDVIVCKYISI